MKGGRYSMVERFMVARSMLRPYAESLCSSKDGRPHLIALSLLLERDLLHCQRSPQGVVAIRASAVQESVDLI
jgi:hypothetical protein